MKEQKIKPYLVFVISLLVSSIGYVGDLIWEGFLNSIYNSIGVDATIGNTAWICMVWFISIRFIYLPEKAPLLYSDSLWCPNLLGEYDIVQNERDELYLFQNNVYYKTDFETLEFLGFLNIRNSDIRFIQLSWLQKSYSTFYFSIKYLNCYILKSDEPRFFFKNGVNLIEIKDIYCYYTLIENHRFDSGFDFEELPLAQFEKWSDGVEFKDSRTIRSAFKIEPSLDHIYLRRIFEEECLETWLQGRFFKDIHLKGRLDKELKIRTDHEFARIMEIDRLQQINNLLVQLDDHSRNLFVIRTASDSLIRICKKIDLIVNQLNRICLIDINDLKYNLNYLNQTNSFLEEVDFNKLINFVNNELQTENHSLSIRHILNGIKDNISKLQKIGSENSLVYNVRGTIVIGDAFMGKTHIIANLVNQRFNENLSSILNRIGVTYDPNWFEVINRSIQASIVDKDQLFKFIDFCTQLIDMDKVVFDSKARIINSRSKFLIASDGMDEAVDVNNWNELINKAEQNILAFPNVHFIYTSRSSFLDKFPKLTTLNQHEIIYLNRSEIDLDSVFNTYKTVYPIKNIENQNWLRKYFTNPLQIRLFFVAFANKDDINFETLDVSLESLLNHYIAYIENRISKLDTSKKLTHLNAGYLQKIISHCGSLIIETDKKYVETKMLLDDINKSGVNLTSESFQYLLNQIKNDDIIFEDPLYGGGYIRFHENSMIEYAIAKSMSKIMDPIPSEIPEYLDNRIGALEIFSQLILSTRNLLIYKDYWINQSVNETRKKVLLGTLKGLPESSIDQELINWIYNEYGS